MFVDFSVVNRPSNRAPVNTGIKRQMVFSRCFCSVRWSPYGVKQPHSVFFFSLQFSLGANSATHCGCLPPCGTSFPRTRARMPINFGKASNHNPATKPVAGGHTLLMWFAESGIEMTPMLCVIHRRVFLHALPPSLLFFWQEAHRARLLRETLRQGEVQEGPWCWLWRWSGEEGDGASYEGHLLFRFWEAVVGQSAAGVLASSLARSAGNLEPHRAMILIPCA